MELLTKQQAAEIAFRPQKLPEAIKTKCVACFCKYSQQKFIKEFRKSTDLNLCSYAPGKFYIKYNN
jgi:hypothetical protein